MSADRDTTRIVRSWLEEGVTALPDRVLDAVLDQVPATPQRRPWRPARRLNEMNTPLKLLIAAAAVVVVALVGINLLPRGGTVGARGPRRPQPDADADPPQHRPANADSHRRPRANFPEGPLTAVHTRWRPHVTVLGVHVPPQSGASNRQGDSIGFAGTVRPGNDRYRMILDGIGAAHSGSAFGPRTWLFTDPCQTSARGLPVGPTVNDFATRWARSHPLYDNARRRHARRVLREAP